MIRVCSCSVCDGIFGFIVKKMSEEEKLEAYALDDEAVEKKDVLIQLSKTICTSVCRPDYVSTSSKIANMAVLQKNMCIGYTVR